VKAFIYIAISMALALQTGCMENHPVGPSGPVVFSDWDTSFTIDQVTFPDTDALIRSVISNGAMERLSAFFKKILIGEEVNIGYIGGSITAGAGASGQENCYANQLARFIRKMFANSHINIINAGIGSTNSRFGCSRIKEDLLNKNSDLVIVEYAVNDNQKDTFTTIAAMEGIIRQCLHHDETLPVILFNTCNSIGDSANQELFKRVGTHYDLPMVSYRNALWPFIQESRIQWSSVVVDAIHPNDNGHLLCAYMLYKFLRKAYSLVSAGGIASDSIPECYLTDMYEHASIYQSSTTEIKVGTDTWSEVAKEYERMGYISQRESDSLVFETNIQEFVIGFLYSQIGNSKILVTVDNQGVDTISNYWANGTSAGYMGLYRVFLEESTSVHRVAIKHLDNELFSLEYLLFSPTSSCLKSIEFLPVHRLNY
jgi:acyl-CoA thioesterase-1